MPYSDLIHDVLLLSGGGATPDYYASLAKKYADKAMDYSKQSETYALSAEQSALKSDGISKEVAIMRDVCKKYYEDVKIISEELKNMEISIITSEDIDIIMENSNGRE